MSIRADTASLIPGTIVCGVPGLGVLGSVILATTGEGGSGPGILFNDVQVGDETKEFRAYIQTWPTSGILDISENGTFTYTGPSANSFTYMGLADGESYGVTTVALYGAPPPVVRHSTPLLALMVF